MKKLSILFCAIMIAAAVNAQPPAGDANPGDYYGEKITADSAVNISDIPAKLEKEESFNTKIKAKVLDVCPKKGCWAKIAVNDSTTAFVKMEGYSFFLPLAVKGKTVVLDGEVTMKTTSVQELKHYASDAKKTKEEIDAITEPEKEINFLARGVLVVE